MIKSNGTNDFIDNNYNKYKWSANLYETAEEIHRFFTHIGIYGKRVIKIDAIGCMPSSFGHWKALAIDALKQAGYIRYRNARKDEIELYDGTVRSANDCEEIFRHARTERRVTLEEPLRILFEDGSTLELQPIAGKGLRIGYNTLPAEMKDGINHHQFDLNDLFASCLSGEKFDSFHMKSANKYRNINHPYIRYETITYTYAFEFGSTEITIQDLTACRYEVFCTDYYHSRITCGDFADIVTQKEQIPIYDGLAGLMKIYPANSSDENLSLLSDCFTVPYDLPRIYNELLVENFDPYHPFNKEARRNSYDYYYWNYFTQESIIKTVHQATKKLEKIKDLNLSDQCRFLSYRADRHSDEEIRNLIDMEIDFTERFSKRLLGLAKHTPNYTAICFAGP